MNLDERIGEKLRKLRSQKGYSTREVGRRIGISNSYVSKIEKGQIPSLTTLEKLCDLYSVDIKEMFGDNPEIPEELKTEDVEWIAFKEEMRKEELTPDEIKKYIQVVKSLKDLS